MPDPRTGSSVHRRPIDPMPIKALRSSALSTIDALHPSLPCQRKHTSYKTYTTEHMVLVGLKSASTVQS
ncbi:hypothetical protein Q5P01_000932 [Channa striata]|uniref:Uncharacterized protein n=1 Tax=Channa striata TaxID=64152 RepID=A0AA88IYH5_CHASR|nr:hypothetical protein Q5P01_000932 [Channa striata]